MHFPSKMHVYLILIASMLIIVMLVVMQHQLNEFYKSSTNESIWVYSEDGQTVITYLPWYGGAEPDGEYTDQGPML
jgi:hypothetical protein